MEFIKVQTDIDSCKGCIFRDAYGECTNSKYDCYDGEHDYIYKLNITEKDWL